MGDLAIALCRVSTSEQLQNNSLNRQDEAVEQCAKELGVKIVRKWSGDVSTKRGKNLKRPDLKEMLDTCKKNRRIKYLLIDEPDRFMRSMNEAIYFEVEFEKLGVKVWYASDAELNSDDQMARFMRFLKYFTAEGSNEERMKKSISGGQKSIRDGKLPSHPKTAYKKGTVSGVHVPDEPIARPFQKALKMVADYSKTPTDALKWLMTTEFGKRHPRYKMDKFRKHACDGYYWGVVELEGKINARNEKGLHEPLISKAEHESILRVFNKNAKKQQGYRPDKETKYPLSNKITCITCELAERRNPRFSSAPISNGSKNHGKVRKKISYYEKYRCRTCNRYVERDQIHDSFSELLNSIVLPEPEYKKLKTKLVATFNAKHNEARNEALRLEAVNASIRQNIANQVVALTDPSNAFIADDIRGVIEKHKAELTDNQEKIDLLSEQHESDLGEFLNFALSFLDDKGKRFFDLSVEHKNWCTQMVFTGKIYVDTDGKVYTHEISPILRYKKDPVGSAFAEKSHMVRVRRL